MKKPKILLSFVILILAIVAFRLIFGAFPIIFIADKPYCIFSDRLYLSQRGFVSDIEELNKISHFVNLKELSVMTSNTDLSYLDELNDISCLNIEIPRYEEKWLDYGRLKRFPKLNRLSLSCYNADGAYIKNSTCLNELSINAEIMNNSEQIWGCTELKNVRISISKGELSLNGISKASDLSFLSLQDKSDNNTKKATISSISEISECKNLSVLLLDIDLEDDAFLKNIPLLEKLAVREGTLTQDTIDVLKSNGVAIEYY